MFFLDFLPRSHNSKRTRYALLDPLHSPIDHDSDSSSHHHLLRKEQIHEEEQHHRTSWLLATYYYLVLACVAFFIAGMAGSIGFFVGRSGMPGLCSSRVEGSEKLYLSRGGPMVERLYPNKSFTQDPLSNATNAVWMSLFPQGGGMVQHPDLSPNVSGIAMFHQLHCLNNLRIGYYHALKDQGLYEQAKNKFERRYDERPPGGADLDPGHMSHCFEYLRLTLMCNADTNLEPVNFDLGGVTGWGSERRCGDFAKVSDWAVIWQGFKPKGNHHHHHHS